MAKEKDKRLELFIKKYLPRLVRLYKPQRLVLFGSRVKGEAFENSDIDLIIVSKAFEGINFLKRIGKVIEDLNFPFGIEPLCYTPEEFREKKKEPGIVRSALKDGKDLLPSPSKR